MKTWRVELTAGGKSLTEAKIQRGILKKRCTIIITIYNCDDAIQQQTQKMHNRIQI